MSQLRYCEYCGSDCQTLTTTTAVSLFGTESWSSLKNVGIGPLSMSMVSEIVSLCELEYPEAAASLAYAGNCLNVVSGLGKGLLETLCT